MERSLMQPDVATVHMPSAALAWTPAPGVRPRGLKRVLRAALGPRLYRSVRAIQWAAFTEHRDARFSWPEKAWAWRRGFLAQSVALYGLSEGDWREYLPDYVRENTAAGINGLPLFFDQKLVLRSILLRHGFAQAETVALLRGADVQLDPLGPRSRLGTLTDLEEMMRRDGGPFIVKPQDSGFGNGVALVEVRDGTLIRHRGRRTVPFAVVPARTSALVERALVQHEFWRELSPVSFNTMRLLTLWTPGDGAPFIARAVQRIGASDTAPTDNFHGGGVAAPVDLETGVMEAACRRDKSGRPTRLPRHPESGAQIAGIKLPFWDDIRRTVLAAASVIGVSRYVGWDILVTADGTPVIIEGNANPGVQSLQLSEGLLKDPAIRRFYMSCGVI
jgi:hypothetical protein